MKRIIAVFLAILVSNGLQILKAQQATQVSSSLGVSCACTNGQTVCSASTFFMSCCTCCQSGSSCGAWSAFGLCSCACESTAGTTVIFHDAYIEFLDVLQRQGISTSNMLSDYQKLISGLNEFYTFDLREKYYNIDPQKARQFAEKAKSNLLTIISDQRNQNFVQNYLSKSPRN